MYRSLNVRIPHILSVQHGSLEPSNSHVLKTNLLPAEIRNVWIVFSETVADVGFRGTLSLGGVVRGVRGVSTTTAAYLYRKLGNWRTFATILGQNHYFSAGIGLKMTQITNFVVSCFFAEIAVETALRVGKSTINREIGQ